MSDIQIIDNPPAIEQQFTIEIYGRPETGVAIYRGASQFDVELPTKALPPGHYAWRCDAHPSLYGYVTVLAGHASPQAGR